MRHGESVGNVERRLQGHADLELTEQGRVQGLRLRDRFQSEGFQPTHIYSSPLQRAAETAQIVAYLWHIPIVHWDRLMEQDIGAFSGLTWAEISAKYSEVAWRFQESNNWDIVEGAETLKSLNDRGRQVLYELKEVHTNDDAVLMFTHGGILQHVVAALLGTERIWEVSVRNTAVFEFVLDIDQWPYGGGNQQGDLRWKIVRFNDVSHLD